MEEQNRWFPINLKIEGKKCLLVGAGKVAEGKARSLVEAGGKIVVIAEEVKSNYIEQLANDGKIELKIRKVEKDDIEGAFIVICATDNREVNNMVYLEADRRNIIINSVDEVENSNFIFPAVLKKKDITIAVSTGGKSPLFSGALKRILNKIINNNYEEMSEVYAEYRKKAYANISDRDKRNAFFSYMKECLNEENMKNTKMLKKNIYEKYEEYIDK